MRPIQYLALVAALAASVPAEAGFFLDRSQRGVELAQAEYPVLRPRAEAGNASNAYFVGLYRYFGLGVERDAADGLRFLHQAAEGGVAGAQYMLGFLYGSGLGPRIDLAESKRWYDLADESWTRGGPDWRMAFAFGEGEITVSNAALQFYAAEAEKGDLGARLRLAYFYGTRYARSNRPADLAEAVKWTKLALPSQHPAALNNMGVLLANGWGEAQNDLDAVQMFGAAAEAGLTEAMVSRAIMVGQGRGVNRDPVEAAKWYAHAAEQSKPLAQIALAYAYARGEGVARDYAQTLYWLIRVSDRGCAIEASLLGVGVGMTIEDRMPSDYQTTEAKHGPCN